MANPTNAIGLLGLVLFGYLIVIPIVALLAESVMVGEPDEDITQQPEGTLTSYYFWRVFVSPQAAAIFWEPLINTLVIAGVSIVLALALGLSIAWLLVRTNTWGRRWFATALIVPYMLPSWTFALAWLTLFKNRTAGGQVGWLLPRKWLKHMAVKYGQ